tara:strand:+ start:15480 stop:16163 length:684 start_codon:yes stop_codon:yes gene_type:complete
MEENTGGFVMIIRKRCRLCTHEDREVFEKDIEDMNISCEELDRQMGWPSGTSAKHQRNHMGHYVDSSNTRCVLCTHPNRLQLEKSLYEGEVSATEVSEMLGCSEQQVLRHTKKHLQPLVQQSAANLIATREVNEIDTLSHNIGHLNSKLDVLMNDDDMSPKAIDSLTKLAKEVRESLKYLMEFKGKLVHKRQDTIVVHQMQVIKEVLAQNHPDVWLDIRKQMEEKMQ